MHTRGHANHHFVVVDPAREASFTGDFFGLAYRRLQRAGRFAFASTSPTGFGAPETLASVYRIVATGARRVLITHFGELREFDVVAAQLRAWIDRSEALVVTAVGRLAAEAEAWIEGELRKTTDAAARRGTDAGSG